MYREMGVNFMESLLYQIWRPVVSWSRTIKPKIITPTDTPHRCQNSIKIQASGISKARSKYTTPIVCIHKGHRNKWQIKKSIFSQTSPFFFVFVFENIYSSCTIIMYSSYLKRFSYSPLFSGIHIFTQLLKYALWKN